LDGSLVSGSFVLQPEGHSCVGICTKRGDECCLDLVFFLEGNLIAARVAIKEGEQVVAGRGVDDLVDAWELEGILWAMLVEISRIHTRPPFIIILFQNEYRVSYPLWVIHFFDEASRE
jgi:hypothetical protein